MAHSVHESAVGAYCSTWVIEYAIHRAMTHIYNDTGHAEVITQANREATWKERCSVQLQQIGICELRGVYEIIPSGRQIVPDHCAFNMAPDHKCDTMYVTEKCLVMCNGQFYDPCRCTTNGIAPYLGPDATVYYTGPVSDAPRPGAYQIARGRPGLDEILQPLLQRGKTSAVLTCGPTAIMDAVEQRVVDAQRAGATVLYHRETFEW